MRQDVDTEGLVIDDNLSCWLLHHTGRGEPCIEIDVSDEITDEEMAVMAIAKRSIAGNLPKWKCCAPTGRPSTIPA